MPERFYVFFTVSFVDSLILVLMNIFYMITSLVFSLGLLMPIITFILTMLLVLSRFKMFIKKNHEGSIKKWFIWFVKKN